MRGEKPFEQIRRAIRESLRRSGVGARTLESKLGLKPWSLRGILDRRRPQVPSVDRAFEICKALGLEFYIGPPRESASPQSPLQREAPPDWAGHLRSGICQDLDRILSRLSLPEAASEKPPEWSRRLREEIRGDLAELIARFQHGAIPAPPLQAPIHEMPAAAGGGSDDFDESVAGHITFTPRWLSRHGLYPPLCTIISVKGQSMEPTLPDGSYTLVDRRQPQRKHGHIVVVKTEEGLLVKRLERDSGGRWWMISDNPAWKPAPWPHRAELIGEVKWSGRLL